MECTIPSTRLDYSIYEVLLQFKIPQNQTSRIKCRCGPCCCSWQLMMMSSTHDQWTHGYKPQKIILEKRASHTSFARVDMTRWEDFKAFAVVLQGFHLRRKPYRTCEHTSSKTSVSLVHRIYLSIPMLQKIHPKDSTRVFNLSHIHITVTEIPGRVRWFVVSEDLQLRCSMHKPL